MTLGYLGVCCGFFLVQILQVLYKRRHPMLPFFLIISVTYMNRVLTPMHFCLRRAFVSKFLPITRSRSFLSHLQYTRMASSIETPPTAEDTLQFNSSHKELQTLHYQSLAVPEGEDDAGIRRMYRPFIFNDEAAEDWVSNLELATVLDMAQKNLWNTKQRLKVLVLYGSLRRRSYSRFVAFEACRILFRLGCDVRVFDPQGLPVKNDTDHGHPKVQELRKLSQWSDGHVWVSPEQHGTLVSNLLVLSCSQPVVLTSVRFRTH